MNKLEESTETLSPDRKDRKRPAKRTKEKIEVDNRKKPHREILPGTIRLLLRCARDSTHAKVIQFVPGFSMETAKTLAGLLDGSSAMYIRKPGPLSPLGKCATCGGAIESTITQVGEA